MAASSIVSACTTDDVRGITLTIPAEYVEDFRGAVVDELAFEVKYVKETREEIAQAKAARDDASLREADYDLALRLLAQDAELLLHVPNQGEAVKIDVPRDDRDGTIGRVLEHMAHTVAKQLAEATNVCPIDAAYAPEIRELMERVSWAVERAVEVRTQFTQSIEAGEAGEAVSD